MINFQICRRSILDQQPYLAIIEGYNKLIYDNNKKDILSSSKKEMYLSKLAIFLCTLKSYSEIYVNREQ
jgi:hypothetical protein